MNNALGCAHSLKGDRLTAEPYLQQAIALSQKYQFVRWEAISCFNLAEVVWKHGRNDQAVEYYVMALEKSRESLDPDQIGLRAYTEGKLALIKSDFHGAMESFCAALKDLDDRGSIYEIGACFESLAVCAWNEGCFERASRLHGNTRSKFSWKSYQGIGGMPWLLSYDLDELLAPAREALGETRYLELFEAGKALPIEKAIALALEVQAV